MADFNVNLSGPQGQGAQVVDPVRTAVSGPADYSGIGEAANIFAKAYKEGKMKDAEGRKQAVIAEYIQNESVYTDALSSGQWQAAHVAMASRANFKKMLGAYPEYMDDLLKAKKTVYDGTETGEAQKKVDAEIALREADKKGASEAGFTFYPGMGEDAQNKTIDAFKFEKRTAKDLEEQRKANAEVRAQNAEGRSEEAHFVAMREEKEKRNAVSSLVSIADKNLEAVSATVQDLMNNTSMTYEQKLLAHSGNINRIKQGMLSVAASNPSLAAPWQKLVEDIDIVAQKLLDPVQKSENDTKTLKAKWESLLYTAKLATIDSNPELLKFVVASQIFNDPALITQAGHGEIKNWLAGAGSGDATHKPANVVGEKNEKQVLNMLEKAIQKIDTSQDKDRAVQEAVNAAEVVMKQTTKSDGATNPSAMKNLAAFYGSSSFGKLAASGKVNMETMKRVKEVFQVSYEPAVQQAVLERMNTPVGEKGEKLSNSVNIKFSGNGVVFEGKASSNPSSQPFLSGWIADGMRGNGITAGNHALKAAEEGLNTLVRVGAHMEGTTDYGAYWEKNKHYLLPTVFPDPVKLKVGQTLKAKNGKTYKYLGGDYNDISGSYQEIPSGPSE